MRLNGDEPQRPSVLMVRDRHGQCWQELAGDEVRDVDSDAPFLHIVEPARGDVPLTLVERLFVAAILVGLGVMALVEAVLR